MFKIAAHLCGWPKEVVDDKKRVMQIVRDAGYDGVEGFGAKDAAELVDLAGLAAEHGLHLVNVGGPDPVQKAKFNATLGNNAAEVSAAWKGGHELTDAELEERTAKIAPEIAAFTGSGSSRSTTFMWPVSWKPRRIAPACWQSCPICGCFSIRAICWPPIPIRWRSWRAGPTRSPTCI